MKKIKVLMVYPNIPLMLVTPLSIAIFTWILKRNGHIVELFDTTKYVDDDLSSPENRVKYLQARKTNLDALDSYEVKDKNDMLNDFNEKLSSFKPELLLYSFSEDSLLRALELLKVSNKLNIPTLVGGIVATSDPEWLLSFPEINMICIEEGEKTVEKMANSIANQTNYLKIPSIWYKKNGQIIKNIKETLVNLDEYSTDFSLFEKERFIRPMGGRVFRAVPIETFRGCPNKCTYCNSPIHNTIAKETKAPYLRRRSINGVKKEMEQLVKNYDIDFFYIIDDDFLARPKKEIYEFIEMYKEIKIPFWFNTRAEHANLDILKKLKEVGLYRISFGIESGNEEFRRRHLGRGASNKKLLEKFDIIYKSGIDFSINVIIGLPYETRELVFDSIEFVKQIKGYDSVTVSIFTPYRGTVLRDKAIEEGWLDPNTLTIHTTSKSILNMPQFTAEQIDGLMKTLVLYIAFDKSHWSEIEKIEKFKDNDNSIYEYYSKEYRKLQWGEDD